MVSEKIRSILAAERADPCPFGRPKVTDAEKDVAAKAVSEYTGGLINGQPARNLAYSVLIALRAANSRYHNSHD